MGIPYIVGDVCNFIVHCMVFLYDTHPSEPILYEDAAKIYDDYWNDNPHIDVILSIENTIVGSIGLAPYTSSQSSFQTVNRSLIFTLSVHTVILWNSMTRKHDWNRMAFGPTLRGITIPRPQNLVIQCIVLPHNKVRDELWSIVDQLIASMK